MRSIDMLPTATPGCELGTATRSMKKRVQDVFVMSARKEVDECRGTHRMGHVGQLSTAW